jgi:hypothetical protein
MGTWSFSPGVKSDHSPSLVLRVRMHGAIPPIPYIYVHMVWCLSEQRDNIAVIFFVIWCSGFSVWSKSFLQSILRRAYCKPLYCRDCIVLYLIQLQHSTHFYTLLLVATLQGHLEVEWIILVDITEAQNTYPEINWPVTYFIFFTHDNFSVSVIVS